MKFIKEDYLPELSHYVYVADEGNVRLVPWRSLRGVVWTVVIDGINMAQTRRRVTSAKRYAETMYKRNGGKALKGPTVLLVRMLDANGQSAGTVEVVACDYDEAVALALVSNGHSVERVDTSQQQPRYQISQYKPTNASHLFAEHLVNTLADVFDVTVSESVHQEALEAVKQAIKEHA